MCKKAKLCISKKKLRQWIKYKTTLKFHIVGTQRNIKKEIKLILNPVVYKLKLFNYLLTNLQKKRH